MDNLTNLEKAINSELSSKIINSKINHNQICININDKDFSKQLPGLPEDLINFLKKTLQ